MRIKKKLLLNNRPCLLSEERCLAEKLCVSTVPLPRTWIYNSYALSPHSPRSNFNIMACSPPMRIVFMARWKIICSVIKIRLIPKCLKFLHHRMKCYFVFIIHEPHKRINEHKPRKICVKESQFLKHNFSRCKRNFRERLKVTTILLIPLIFL